MLNVNENINLGGNITTIDGDKTVTALLVSASLNSDATNVSFNVTIVNKDILANHLDDIKTQLNDFKTQVQNKMKDLGYQITF
jgi:hypothetical protein